MISRHCKSPALAIPALLVLLAGCGVGQFETASANGAFSLSASSTTVSSNSQVRFGARLPSGQAAPVVWSVSGDNAPTLGEGHVDSKGLYTPPSALSQNSVTVQVTARLKGDSTEVASKTLSITPGFVQPLLPENASLATGATLEAKAEIAEVNAGSVHWSLSTNAPSGSDAGTLSNASCKRSLDQYTTCKVLYTAPLSPSNATVYLKATVDGSATAAPLKILLNADGVNSAPIANQSAQNGAISLGSSGGNDNDYDTYQDASGESYVADCCGGTLGALVEDSKHDQYILSNNHVLAESDQGRPGDAIDQPGMIDDGCVPLSHAGSTLRPVGTLKYLVPLASSQTNVDAALASVIPGAVNPDGSILQLASPTHSENSSEMLGAAPPMAGTGEALSASNLNDLKLVKSGRTTGLTCSTVAALDLSVKVDYFKDCAETQPYYTKVFTGQIAIAGDRFSDSGDSGALVLDASNAEPVGLFFAGGTDGKGHGLSIANPIGDVLRELGTETGSAMSIVGSSSPHNIACVRYDSRPPVVATPLSAQAAALGEHVAQTAGALLVNPEKGILAVSNGSSLDHPGDPALVVYVDNAHAGASVPPTVQGVRTQVIRTDAAALARNAAPQTPQLTDGLSLTSADYARAKAVVAQYAPSLLHDPSIFGVGVARSLDNPRDPALLVLVDPNISPRAMPATLGGLRVRFMKLNRFHVTRSKHAGPNPAPSCAIKKMAGTSSRGKFGSILAGEATSLMKP
ncbi:MAG: hypothetical protein ACRD3F_07400 [Acidobacteriaceae bacterium]